ncbi:MAG: 4'-phosphopantetheinyl transferase superfamily protein, partial [Acutalibacteraceae bacterium]|nr:4'-phosphopantetheinyl transferase superfamily protein [Acutalibacteraceae bacterium]
TSDEKFTRIWAIKEAYIKLNGVGLSKSLSSFNVFIDKNNVKINNDNSINIKEYRFKDYFIAICCNKSVTSDELTILEI